MQLIKKTSVNTTDSANFLTLHGI